MVDPAITAAVITVAFMVLSGLLGLVYQHFNKRISELEDETDGNGSDYHSVKERVNTIWNFLFGVREDPEDGGLSADIQEGFNNIEDELSETQSRQQQFHTEEMDYLQKLVNELHDDESVDIEREDVFGD